MIMKTASKIMGSACIAASLALIFGCNKDSAKEDGIVSVSTIDVSKITSSSAMASGHVESMTEADIKVRGVCWSTNEDPILEDNKTTAGSGTGSFTSYLTSLKENTVYYVRAYAISSTGTFFGNQLSFTTGSSLEVLLPSGSSVEVPLASSSSLEVPLASSSSFEVPLASGSVLLTGLASLAF